MSGGGGGGGASKAKGGETSSGERGHVREQQRLAEKGRKGHVVRHLSTVHALLHTHSLHLHTQTNTQAHRHSLASERGTSAPHSTPSHTQSLHLHTHTHTHRCRTALTCFRREALAPTRPSPLLHTHPLRLRTHRHTHRIAHEQTHSTHLLQTRGTSASSRATALSTPSCRQSPACAHDPPWHPGPAGAPEGRRGWGTSAQCRRRPWGVGVPWGPACA